MPTPTSPIFPGIPEVIYAKDQPQYNPLPSVRGDFPEVPVTSRWKLNDGERAAIAAGADVYLTLYTFGGPLQPILMTVYHEGDAETALRSRGLLPESPNKE